VKQETKYQVETTVRQAGRSGGLAVLRRRGPAWFSQIGLKGQQGLRAKHPGKAKEWGRLGGRPRKPSLRNMGEESIPT
jgi:hypothetical protein